MKRKIGNDAFHYYFGLGPGRSYQAVAENYDVCKQTVVNLATKEDWQPRLERIEQEARERTDRQAADTLEAMNVRHLSTLQIVQRKALEALRSQPIGTAMEAVRALNMAIGQERVIRGEPSDHVSIEQVTRREMQRWLVAEEDEDVDAGDEQPAKDAHESAPA